MPKTSRRINPETSTDKVFTQEEKAILSEKDSMIAPEEKKEILGNWTSLNFDDLNVDWDLRKKVEDYIEYQRRMDAMRETLALRYIGPYVVPCDGDSGTWRVNLYLNRNYIIEVRFYRHNGTFRALNYSDFRLLLMALRRDIAKWIPSDVSKAVDVVAWVTDNGGSIDFNYGFLSNCVNVRLPE